MYSAKEQRIIATSGGGGGGGGGLVGLLKEVGAAGGAAVIAVTFIHPIDVVKTRLQVGGKYAKLGLFGTAKDAVANEGVLALWKGIGPAWLREASYTSLRLGLYSPIKKAMGADKPDAWFIMKFSAGSAAGAIGSLAGNPFDVLKTQMMTAAQEKPPTLPEAASALYANQGLGGFYRGLEANVARAMVLNGTKMACYDSIKQSVKAAGVIPEGIPTQFASAMGAGFFMACTVAPFDMVRTRLMNQPADAKIYSGAIDCVSKILAAEGPGGFYRGFFPIWMRFAPTTCLQLIIFEQLRGVLGMKAM